MPKTKYGLWSEEDMDRAIDSFRNGDAGINEICRRYGVPKPTLKRRLEGKNKIACGNLKTFGRPVDLPSEIEKELVEHILFMESNLLGCTRAFWKKEKTIQKACPFLRNYKHPLQK